MIIAVDFDGTCVEHAFPKVGKDIGAAPVLRKLIAKGHKVFIWTVRGNSPKDCEGIEVVNYIEDVKKWLKENYIEATGINESPSNQIEWSDSPKQYAQLYIDDSALGAPLTYKGYIDWNVVTDILWSKGIFTTEDREKVKCQITLENESSLCIFE